MKVARLGIRKSISLLLFIKLNPSKNKEKIIIKMKLIKKNRMNKHFIFFKTVFSFFTSIILLNSIKLSIFFFVLKNTNPRINCITIV